MVEVRTLRGVRGSNSGHQTIAASVFAGRVISADFYIFLTLSHTHRVAKGEDGLQPLLQLQVRRLQACGAPTPFFFFKERQGKQASICTVGLLWGAVCRLDSEQHPLSPAQSLETFISKPLPSLDRVGAFAPFLGRHSSDQVSGCDLSSIFLCLRAL